MVRVDPPTVDFGEFERDVTAFLAVLSAKNSSGKMASTRIASIRAEIAGWRDLYGIDAMLNALRVTMRAERRKPMAYAESIVRDAPKNGAHPSDDGDLPDIFDLLHTNGATR